MRPRQETLSIPILGRSPLDFTSSISRPCVVYHSIFVVDPSILCRLLLDTLVNDHSGGHCQERRSLTPTKSIEKEGMSMNEFLLNIINVVDLLSLCDEVISLKEHVDAIFDGLPNKYEIFITNFTLRS